MRMRTQHASLPVIEKVPIQVGPRFGETTLTYDSFDGTHYILESFSCKLVVMYRVIRWRGNIAVTHVANASRRA